MTSKLTQTVVARDNRRLSEDELYAQHRARTFQRFTVEYNTEKEVVSVSLEPLRNGSPFWVGSRFETEGEKVFFSTWVLDPVVGTLRHDRRLQGTNRPAKLVSELHMGDLWFSEGLVVADLVACARSKEISWWSR